MAKNFFQQIETPTGPVMVHVNRRGCKGRWTTKDAEMLQKLTEAVVRMEREKRLPPTERPDA